MLLENILLPTVLLPFLVAAVVHALSTLIGKRRKQGGANAGLPGGGLAVAAAFLSSYVAMTGWPRFPPVEATQRLFFVVLALGAISFILAGRLRAVLRFGIALLALAGLLFWILQPPIQNIFTHAQTALWLGALTIVGLILVLVFERVFEPAGDEAEGAGAEPSSLLSAAVTLSLLGGASILLGVSESARLAQLLGATTCGVLAIEIVSRLTRRPAFAPLDALVLSAILLGLLVCGYFYAELTPLPAGLCFLSFILLGLTTRARASIKPIAAVPLLIGVLISGYAYMNQPEDPYAGYYESD